MSGPALTPIANIAPTAPPKGTEASNQDVAAQSEPDKAGTGFASELKRQMKDASPADEERGAGSDTEADAAARSEAAAQSQPPVQPELAALLNGLIPTATLPATGLPTDAEPAAPSSDEAPLLSNMATDERHAPIAGLRRVEVQYPAGRIQVEVELSEVDGQFKLVQAALLRTARKILEGTLFVPESAPAH